MGQGISKGSKAAAPGKSDSLRHTAGRAPGRRDEFSGYAHGWSRTEVSRPVAVWLSILFCAGLLVVPLADALLGSWSEPLSKARKGISRVMNSLGGLSLDAAVRANRAALGAIETFETSLEDSSALGASIRPPVLDGLLRLGGAGSEEAYVGRDGWLFYRPDVDALVLPSADPDDAARGIGDFATELAARGIRLVVVPVPGKASIHPEMLAPEGTVFSAPPVSPALASLADRVAAAWQSKHVAEASAAPSIIDPAAMLWGRKKEQGAQFLRTDSHWTPSAMQAVARMVADAIAPALPGKRPDKLESTDHQVAGVGDTALMHSLPASSPLLEKQMVQLEKVTASDGMPWRADRDSPVLVLGDSYTNIYSSEDLGWGESSGFAEHLSLALGYRVDKLARNDAGARAAREMLGAEAARHAEWLEGKKVVVWVMAAREFVRGDWKPVPLPGPDASAAKEFFVVPRGESLEVEATVRAMGPLPEPGDTPYADYLTALHLSDMHEASTGREMAGDALAYIFTMRGRKPVRLPDLVEGARVKLRLSNYAENADTLDPLNRGELDDVEVMMQDPNYAEWTELP